MITKLESTTTGHGERLRIILTNEATADLSSTADIDAAARPVMRWRLRLTPPAWLEWAEGSGASVLLGTRRHLALVAAAWILLWSGGNLDVDDLETETAAALMGLRVLR